ncbi:MAG: rhomboid family intramembrane serine protease [Acidobacteriota bacterium]|nr:rhomboid family intramembrane serine protease [Acidobacteriota bacterium]
MALPYWWQMRVDRWRSAIRGLFGGGEREQPRPKICPACGTLVGISATRCHQCGTSLNFSMAAINKRFSGVFGGRAPVTTALLIANILIFGVSVVATLQAGKGGGLSLLWGIDGEALYRLGALWTPAIEHGEAYRLVTAMFLHGGLIHIGFNMMVLMDIGPVVEEVYGSARFLFLYTAVGVGGYILSAFTPFRPHPALAVGASGAILGLIGVMIALTTRRGGASMQALRSRLVSWVVSIFVFGFLMSGIDNWAHGGGLVSGFLLGKVLADREPMNPGELKRAQALGWAAAAVLLASFAFMIMHFRDPLP